MDITVPLHNLTKKDVLFSCSPECNKAFAELKNRLTQAPILAFPHFKADAAPFLLQTDASAVGLGAVLEQGGRVIAYASRALNQEVSPVVPQNVLRLMKYSEVTHLSIPSIIQDILPYIFIIF